MTMTKRMSVATGLALAVVLWATPVWAQQRPLVMAPRNVSKQDLEGLYRNALRYW